MKKLFLNGFGWIPFFGTLISNMVEKPKHTVFSTVFLVTLFVVFLLKAMISFDQSEE